MAGFGKHAGAVDGDPNLAILRRRLEGRPEFGKHGRRPLDEAPVLVPVEPVSNVHPLFKKIVAPFAPKEGDAA